MTHWKLSRDGKSIVVKLNDGTEAIIATVTNQRACRQMLRYAEAAEEVEAVIDKLIAEEVEAI